MINDHIQVLLGLTTYFDIIKRNIKIICTNRVISSRKRKRDSSLRLACIQSCFWKRNHNWHGFGPVFFGCHSKIQGTTVWLQLSHIQHIGLSEWKFITYSIYISNKTTYLCIGINITHPGFNVMTFVKISN